MTDIVAYLDILLMAWALQTLFMLFLPSIIEDFRSNLAVFRRFGEKLDAFLDDF
jgi:hypothetical protein